MADRIDSEVKTYAEPTLEVTPPVEVEFQQNHTPLNPDNLPHGPQDAAAVNDLRESLGKTQVKKFEYFKPEKPLEAPAPVTPPKKSLWQNLKVAFSGQPIQTLEKTQTSEFERVAFLKQVGFEDFNEVVTMWEAASRDPNVVERAPNQYDERLDKKTFESPYSKAAMIEKHLKMMKQLELKRPGICRTLFDSFGIVNYGRYTEELLLNQYDHMQDINTKFGLAMVDARDPQGMLATDGDAYTDLMNQAKAQGVELRIVEYRDAKDLRRHLKDIRDHYVEKSSFGVISTLKTQELIEQSLQSDYDDFSDYFQETASISILSADIVAETIRDVTEKTGISIKVPDKNANQVYMKITQDPGMISLISQGKEQYGESRGKLVPVKSERVVPSIDFSRPVENISEQTLPKAA